MPLKIMLLLLIYLSTSFDKSRFLLLLLLLLIFLMSISRKVAISRESCSLPRCLCRTREGAKVLLIIAIHTLLHD